MDLLLRRNVNKLGIVGDVVKVKDGYARNYLIPQGLAIAPTDANKRTLAEARKVAERDLGELRARLAAANERLHGVEVTIAARANEDGVLYGSVGRREIAEALNALGHDVTPDHVVLHDPIRQLDNVSVDVKLDTDLKATVKVWVVREKTADELEADVRKAATAKEAGGGGDGAAVNN